MISMKVVHKMKKPFFIAAFAITLILSLTLFSAFSVTAKAESAKAEFYNPATLREYKELVSPIDSYMSEDVFAVICGKSLYVEKGDGYKPIDGFNSPNQVKRFNDNYLVISDYGSLYLIDIRSLEKTPLTYERTENVGANFFDINDNYLVTVYQQNAYLYTINPLSQTGGYLTGKLPLPLAVNGNNPISVDKNGIVYYVNSADFNIHSYDKDTEKDETFYEQTPTAMITGADGLYTVSDKRVNKISYAAKTRTILTSEEEVYDLGKILSPSGIAFYNEKFIVTDSELNAVSEFNIVDDKLMFTGYAVCKGKTAFNRISANVYQTEVYKDTVAVADNNKITVVRNGNFINLFPEQKFSSVALGENSIVIKTDAEKLLYYSFDKKEYKELPFSSVKDVCYRNGKYYVLHYDVLFYGVTAVEETSLKSAVLIERMDETNLTVMAVDVFGNVIAADSETVYFYYANENYVKNGNSLSVGNVKKIIPDAAGNLTFLSNGKLYNYDGAGLTEKTFSATVSAETVTSAAFDTFRGKLYFTVYGEEAILKTSDSGNTALSDFSGDALFSPAEYLKSIVFNSDVPEKVYVTTGVGGYKVPLITENGEYILIKSGESVRIPPKTEIKPISKINYNGRDFYLAKVTVKGETFNCYVPVSFTVTTLSEDVTPTTFTLGKVKNTKAYSDKSLKKEIYELKEDSDVRIYEKTETYAKIAFYDGEKYVDAYIFADDLKLVPDTLIRKLIVVAVISLCVAVSSLYFIFKRKRA